jgi:glycosyltransferase involved in cell wall biosynthesis
LFAAGAMRDPNHQRDFDYYVSEMRKLEKAGIARFYEFIPRGEIYYKVMAMCDFVILPTLDETQSGTLARIIALNKPYITTAPIEGLTAQTVESEGGLLFTNRETLKRRILRLATNEELRWHLGEKLKHYLNKRVSWDLVARQYIDCYELARQACKHQTEIECSSEFSANGFKGCKLPLDSMV